MYSAIDLRADELAVSFCTKAEALWAAERQKGIDSTTTIAATEFLSLGYLGHGRDHSVWKYAIEAANMGARMGLFKVAGQTQAGYGAEFDADGAAHTSRSYAAWGTFNWLTLVSERLINPIS